MRTALSKHDHVLQAAIESHDGFIFSHTGDGVVAAFASPASAVDAAVAAQRALELPVRMGIATGEAELRDGDYFGTVLNRAARVMTAGHGGQILVADSTAGLLSGVDLLDLGPHRLRDVPNRITVLQLRAPGLPTDFPPLRGVDPNPGNLRPAITSLIGRDADVSDVQAALRSHRLVTLTGVGGVGKTRLALEVATLVANEFVDGVWVFELAAVPDPSAVPDSVAAVLGTVQQPAKTVGESIAAALEGRVRLLVFDNCEHVLDAAADLAESILAASATVKMLATSREGLGIAGEQVWPVPSLDVGASVDLFVERAHSVAPGFTADNADAVEEICRRLDGIPLAIELAASRMASMSASEVRDRLDDRFRLLVRSRRGLDRHQTLRQAVAWSYELLEDAEKAALERCSVFTGGFDLESACAIAGSDKDEVTVLNLLDALVRKSLLVVDRSFARTRYSMLETIRQFAEDQLITRGEATDASSAHARHFARRETEILALWDSPRQSEAYTWFTAELANLRTAFRWATDYDDLDVAASIATYAAFLGYLVENYEPITWAEELIHSAKAADHPRLAFLYVMASCCWRVGRIEDAFGYTDAGQAVIRNCRGEVPYGIEAWLGGAYLATGESERWVEWCRAQLARGRNNVLTRACLVLALATAGSRDDAITATNGLVNSAESACNPHALSFALLAFGYALRDADPSRAREALHRGLLIAQESGDRENETHLASNLSRVEAEHGLPLAALDYVTLAIRNYHDSGDTVTMRTALATLAAFFDRLGRFEAAATIAGFAFSPFTAAAFPEINTAIAHLREILGDDTYESIGRNGEKMSNNTIATYAYEQIDQARAELTPVSK